MFDGESFKSLYDLKKKVRKNMICIYIYDKSGEQKKGGVRQKKQSPPQKKGGYGRCYLANAY